MVVPAEPILKSKSYKEASPMGGVPIKKSSPKGAASGSMAILQNALKGAGVPENNIQEFLGSMAALVKGNKTRLVQIGETVFALNGFDSQGKELPPGIVSIVPYSTEEKSQVIERFKVLPTTLKEMGVKKFMMTADDSADLMALQMAGMKYTTKPSQTISGNQAVPALIVEVTV
jgi:hypothetical protein